MKKNKRKRKSMNGVKATSNKERVGFLSSSYEHIDMSIMDLMMSVSQPSVFLLKRLLILYI